MPPGRLLPAGYVFGQHVGHAAAERVVHSAGAASGDRRIDFLLRDTRSGGENCGPDQKRLACAIQHVACSSLGSRSADLERPEHAKCIPSPLRSPSERWLARRPLLERTDVDRKRSELAVEEIISQCAG